MTIKRRIFFSNILMIIIPLLLSLVLLSSVRFIFSQDRRDTNDPFGFMDFFHEIVNMQAFADSWNGDIAQIAAYMEDFEIQGVRRRNNNLVLFLYDRDDVLLEPLTPPVPDPVLMLMSLQEPPATVIKEGTAVHVERIGEYRFVLADTNFNFIEGYYARFDLFIMRAVAVIACFIFFIILTNILLTRFVFKKIVFALDTLEYGVSQISEGNLSYRIQYPEADEFAGVCANFNGMAVRLLDSVNLRQKDENSRRELIAGISHDLRTPLTVIRGCVEGIGQGLVSTPAMWARYAETIQNKVRDLEQIIDTLFLFSRLDLGEFPWRMERTDLVKHLFDEFSGLQSEYAQRGLDIALRAEAEETLLVNVDFQQLRNAMINILENSLKYKTGTRVKMEICLSHENECAVVTMTDDGPGVPEEMLDRLFDVFFRCDASRNGAKKGYGMGLAIVVKIIKSFGGDISAENASEGGLSIHIKLPIFSRAEEQPGSSNHVESEGKI